MDERYNMMSLSRITRAYNLVRSGRVRSVAFAAIRDLFVAAHSTEFFTREQEMLVERVEAAALAA